MELEKWLGEKIGNRCIKNLKKHGFDAHFFETPMEARSLVVKLADDTNTIGIGGSDTIRNIGIAALLQDEGKTVYDHWQMGLSKEDIHRLRLEQGRCDMFLCSANAIAATGEIVNVDGIGNRTAAMSFGPKKVVIVAGINKITPDLDSALRRVREVAAPMRAKSLGMETPCAETGICSDCNAPQRICRITTILHRQPMTTPVTIIIVNTSLGY